MRSRPRRRTLTGVALAVTAVLAVSGCTFHPGNAAVVDGTNIAQTRVDNLVLAACGFFKANRIANGGASPATSTAYLRHLFTQDLISYDISQRAADALRLTVSPAAVAKVTSSQTLPAGMSSADKKLLSDFFDSSAKAQLQQAVIGAHLKDPSVTTADNVSPNDIKAAQKYLTAYTERQHVVVNPAYGSWSGDTLEDTEGSLSVPQSEVANSWLRLRKANANSVTGLPPSQVCG